MELRIKLAPYLLTKANSEQHEQSEQPLFIDGPEPTPVKIYKKFGLDPDLLKDPFEFDFDEWGRHMKEKSDNEEVKKLIDKI